MQKRRLAFFNSYRDFKILGCEEGLHLKSGYSIMKCRLGFIAGEKNVRGIERKTHMKRKIGILCIFVLIFSMLVLPGCSSGTGGYLGMQ